MASARFFVCCKVRQARSIPDLRIFAKRAFLVGSMVMLMFGGAFYGVTYLLPQFMDAVLHYSPIASGLLFPPPTVVLAVLVDQTFIARGEYVLAGQSIVVMHEPADVWIESKMKETKITQRLPVCIAIDDGPRAELAPGRMVEVDVDITADARKRNSGKDKQTARDTRRFGSTAHRARPASSD